MQKHKLYFGLSMGVLAAGIVVIAAFTMDAFFALRAIGHAPVLSRPVQAVASIGRSPQNPVTITGKLTVQGDAPMLDGQRMAYLRTEYQKKDGSRWRTQSREAVLAESIRIYDFDVSAVLLQLPLKRVRYQIVPDSVQVIYHYIPADDEVSLYFTPAGGMARGAQLAYGTAAHLMVSVMRQALFRILITILICAVLYLPLRSRYLAYRGGWRWYRRRASSHPAPMKAGAQEDGTFPTV